MLLEMLSIDMIAWLVVELKNSEIYLQSSEEGSLNVSLVGQKLWDSATENLVVIIASLSIPSLELGLSHVDIDKLNSEKVSFEISDVMKEEIKVCTISNFTWLRRFVISISLSIQATYNWSW